MLPEAASRSMQLIKNQAVGRRGKSLRDHSNNEFAARVGSGLEVLPYQYDFVL